MSKDFRGAGLGGHHVGHRPTFYFANELIIFEDQSLGDEDEAC